MGSGHFLISSHKTCLMPAKATLCTFLTLLLLVPASPKHATYRGTRCHFHSEKNPLHPQYVWRGWDGEAPSTPLSRLPPEEPACGAPGYVTAMR